MIGTEIDARYRIDALLGKGGIGTVYRAVRLSDGRPVALKVIRPEFAASSELRHRFDREARALSALSHPGIVAVLDSGVSGDTPYLVMELLEGETLAERLRRGRLSLGEALDILHDLLAALAFVHEKGLVHRDVKPANVFLQPMPDGTARVRLLDFGLAKFLTPEAGERALTRAGQVFGTPSYMAPEQIAGQEADPKADVYASGIVLFEMLAGAPPYRGEAAEIMRRQIMDDLPIEQLPSEVATDAVVRFLVKATAKTRPERFANAGEMLAALDAELLGERSGIALDATVQATMDEDVVGGGPFRSLSRALVNGITIAAMVVSGAAVVAAAVGVYVLMHPEHEKERRAVEAVLGSASGRAPAVSSEAPVRESPQPEATAEPRPSAAATEPPLPVMPPPSAAAPAEPAEPPPLAPSASPPRGPVPNPWVPMPASLGKLFSKVSRGRALEKREMLKVHEYNAKHPGDPRGHLLLARSYSRRRWVKDAASEYAIAYKADPDARGDPRMLPDLLYLVQLGSEEAGRIVAEAYGADALPAIDSALAGKEPNEATERLQKVKTAIRP